MNKDFTTPDPGGLPPIREARFTIGDVVRHRHHDFRGVVFDVDPIFSNSEEWYQSIPEDVRPTRDQPYYHLLAENDESSYIAYVSQQNLVIDGEAGPIYHPAIEELFEPYENGRYPIRAHRYH